MFSLNQGIVSVTRGDNETLVEASESVYIDENGIINSLCGPPKFLYHDPTPNPHKVSGLQVNPSVDGGVATSPSGGASADPDAPPPPPQPPAPPSTEPITEPVTPDPIVEEEPRASPN